MVWVRLTVQEALRLPWIDIDPARVVLDEFPAEVTTGER